MSRKEKDKYPRVISYFVPRLIVDNKTGLVFGSKGCEKAWDPEDHSTHAFSCDGFFPVVWSGR